MNQQAAIRDTGTISAHWELLETLCLRLASLVEAENVALENGDLKDMKTTGPEFEQLSTQYGREIADAKTKGGLTQMPAAMKARLRQAGARLKKALDRHQMLAEAMRYVSEGMVQSVANEVVKQRKQHAPYSPQQGAKPTQASALSAAIVYNKIV